MQRLHSFLFLYFLVSALKSLVLGIKWEELTENPKYFYSREYEDRGSVLEYIPSEHEDPISTGDDNGMFIHLKKDEATVVEFYAPWCPHCQHFRNHYVDMADEVHRRIYGVPNIMFYGLTCDSYRPLCDKYSIAGYPTLVGFKAGFQQGVDKPMILNDDGMPSLTADLIGEYLGLNLANEEPEVLSMSSYSNSEDTRAKEERHRKAAVESAQSKIRNYEYKKSYQDIYLDAAKSLVFTLRQSIYVSTGPLAEERKDVLIEWLDLLSWSLPNQFGIHSLITDARNNIDIISSGSNKLLEVIERHETIKDWDINLSDVLKKNQKQASDENLMKDAKKWSEGCSHGKIGAGYTCGLWELFHIMTIGVVERFEDKNDKDNIKYSAQHAAQSLRNFVEHFFGCQVCRSHFIDNFDSCGGDVCHRLSSIPSRSNSKQLAIWLWETHNTVNRRLMSEAAHRVGRYVDPIEEDASSWPTQQMCGSCWTQDNSFDDETIYRFLKKTYWPIDERIALSTFDIVHYDDDYDDSNSSYDIIPSLIWFIPSMFVALVVTSQTMKQRRLLKTGRHKKRDDSLQNLF